MFEIRMPEDVADIINTIEAAGYEAYIVGGCVRDALLMQEPHDWDITTSATPEEVKALFRHTFDTGIQHGTVTVVLHGENYEVTTYRVDGKYSDGRHPDTVGFTVCLEEDLKRRDFTINAMAYHPKRGLVDLFSGTEDLKNGIIRCVGDAGQRFTEDSLRMMRAVRFAAKLGFEIEKGTYAAILSMADRLDKVSAERITDEMVKLLVSDHPEMFAELYRLGLTKSFFPEFDEMMVCSQNTKYHCLTVGEHTLKVLGNVRADKVLRLSALLHDVGKIYTKTTKDGVDHFYGHAAVSAEKADGIIKRWKLDNETRRCVCLLAKYHDARFDVTEKNIRKLMGGVGRGLIEDLIELMEADLKGKSEFAIATESGQLQNIRKTYEIIKARGDAINISELDITGDDLIAIGIPRGRMIGEMLKYLLEIVYEEPLMNKKETLIELAVKKK